MKKYLRIGLFGLLIWLIPFITGFLFYSPEGDPLVDKIVFGTIMIVIGSITGATLLVLYFKKVEIDYLKEGIVIGFVWLVINWILDLIILVPMSDQVVGEYFAELGLRYLMIPIMSITVGYLLNRVVQKTVRR